MQYGTAGVSTPMHLSTERYALLNEIRLTHVPFRGTGPLRSWRDLLAGALTAELSWTEQVKLLELLLRATPAEELGEAADEFGKRWLALGR